MLRVAIACFLFSVSLVVFAQERIADLDNSFRAEYQYIRTGEFDSDDGPFEQGYTDTHAMVLSAVYSLNDRWKIYGSLPYVQKRQVGTAGTHNTAVDFVNYQPPDTRFIDDGHYHGGLQDIHAGVQYLAYESPAFSLSPYVSYGVPISDYPIYGAAAIGKNLKELHLGVSMEFTPYFSDWYFQADFDYAIAEEVLGINLDYWLLYVSASYYVTPRFIPRVYLSSRDAPNGLTYPTDFPDWDTPNGYHHDQTLKHSYVNAGIGFDYLFSEQYSMAATYYKSIDTDNILEVDYAFTLALTRRF